MRAGKQPDDGEYLVSVRDMIRAIWHQLAQVTVLRAGCTKRGLNDVQNIGEPCLQTYLVSVLDVSARASWGLTFQGGNGVAFLDKLLKSGANPLGIVSGHGAKTFLAMMPNGLELSGAAKLLRTSYRALAASAPTPHGGGPHSPTQETSVALDGHCALYSTARSSALKIRPDLSLAPASPCSNVVPVQA